MADVEGRAGGSGVKMEGRGVRVGGVGGWGRESGGGGERGAVFVKLG